jgi:hypothetical protein
MNISELRIGNYIQDKDGNIETVSKLFHQDYLSKINDDPYEDYYNPVPLTEEWLLKLELIKNKTLFELPKEIQETRSDDNGIGTCAFFYNKRLNRWMDCHSRVCIDFVHQCQNLVFVITGKELKINN